jgi:hypothetical protein
MFGAGRDVGRRWRLFAPGYLVVALVSIATMLAALSLIAAAARSSAPPSPWDGTNPFSCTIQDAGLGPTGPDPAADPYCVRFDKTHQNVTQLGIVDFLLKEPARTAAAAPKCFYFQEDHWRGSVVQSDQRTVVYEFQGHYFFDKATGDGGAWVTGFSIAGQTFDPTALPGFPPGYGGYFGPGTGGFITHNDVPTDPRCVALAKQNPSAVYSQQKAAAHCVPGTGRVDRHGLGPLELGSSEQTVRAELGPPDAVKRGFLRYCVTGGGALLVGQPGDRSGSLGSSGQARTVVLLTTAPGFVLHGGRGTTLTVGSSVGTLRRAFPHGKRLTHIAHTGVVRVSHRIILGTARGRVVYLAVYDRLALRTKRTLKSYLRRAG